MSRTAARRSPTGRRDRAMRDPDEEREADSDARGRGGRARAGDLLAGAQPLRTSSCSSPRLWRLVRGEDERGRKVRWLLGLLRPYRGRVA